MTDTLHKTYFLQVFLQNRNLQILAVCENKKEISNNMLPKERIEAFLSKLVSHVLVKNLDILVRTDKA